MGRRAKPIELHQLGGNPSKLSNEELSGAQSPQPRKGEPEMPKGMPKVARREWRRIVPQLMEIGVLSCVDGQALAAYCRACAMVEIAQKEIDKYGIQFVTHYTDREGNVIVGDLKANPAVSILNQAEKTKKTFLIEFGLTPASRRNLKIEKKPAGDNPMEAYMSRKPSSERPKPLLMTPVAPPKEMEP